MGKLHVLEHAEGINVFIFTFQVGENKIKVWNKRIWNINGSSSISAGSSIATTISPYVTNLWKII